MKIFNTLTRKVEEFEPITLGKVGMYTCGPTVYNYQHIGNFRTMIFSDILTRVLTANGYEVKTVRNITDIDDKIIRDAKAAELPIHEFTEKYETAYNKDLQKLNVLPVDVSPLATEHINGMIKFIEVLIKKDVAYVEDDGSVYFDISKFADYGKLSRLDKKNLKTGTRILSDEYEKDNIQDFALWKSVEPGEFGYESPWGKGRPGWHIECSVMSEQFLGETFDIHAGGIDLMFPHHENEIAQSEAKNEKPFVKYFVHGEHILVNNEKMSKSKKNYFVLGDLEEKGFDPMAYRYLVLTTHYRDKLNFTWESLEAAQNALNNLREDIRDWEAPLVPPLPNPLPQGERGLSNPENSFYSQFLEVLNNDLNTPQALAVLWKMVKANIPGEQKAEQLLKMDQVLGLKLDEYLGKKLEIPDEVQKLVDQRELVRAEKDFAKSDELRKEVKNLGYEIDDTPSGPKLHKI